MTEESSESIDDVRALVAERHRFDEWLSALESRRDETPEHVYERVHRDYTDRRTDVMTQLHGHVPGLDALLAELDGRAAGLATRAQAEEDERAEAMLRHAVGEFDDDKWNEVRERVESTLATLGKERDALDEQRSDVGALLKSARPEPVAAVLEVADDVSNAFSDDVSEAEAAFDAAFDAATSDEPASRDDAPAEPSTTERSSSESSSASSSPFSETSTRDSSSAASDTDRSDADRSEPDLQDVDALELTTESPEPPTAPPVERPSIWGTPRPPRDAEPRKPASSDADDERANDVFGDARSDSPERPRTADTGSSPRPATPKSGAPSDGFDELAFLRSVIDPQAKDANVPRAPKGETAQKTLRCTECGSMNLPTEWYCERCGGELAAF